MKLVQFTRRQPTGEEKLRAENEKLREQVEALRVYERLVVQARLNAIVA
jgi:hypothetical protein